MANPEDGALVHGLFTDAWKWDNENMCMTESDYGVMNNTLPVFHMLPEMDFTPPKIDYICPLYKEGLRAGTLSTTGKFCILFIIKFCEKIVSIVKVDFLVLVRFCMKVSETHF